MEKDTDKRLKKFRKDTMRAMKAELPDFIELKEYYCGINSYEKYRYLQDKTHVAIPIEHVNTIVCDDANLFCPMGEYKGMFGFAKNLGKKMITFNPTQKNVALMEEDIIGTVGDINDENFIPENNLYCKKTGRLCEINKAVAKKRWKHASTIKIIGEDALLKGSILECSICPEVDIKFTDNGQGEHIRAADVRSEWFAFINPTTKRILDIYLTLNLVKGVATGGTKMAINVFKGGKIALNFAGVKKGVDFFLGDGRSLIQKFSGIDVYKEFVGGGTDIMVKNRIVSKEDGEDLKEFILNVTDKTREIGGYHKNIVNIRNNKKLIDEKFKVDKEKVKKTVNSKVPNTPIEKNKPDGTPKRNVQMKSETGQRQKAKRNAEKNARQFQRAEDKLKKEQANKNIKKSKKDIIDSVLEKGNDGINYIKNWGISYWNDYMEDDTRVLRMMEYSERPYAKKMK